MVPTLEAYVANKNKLRKAYVTSQELALHDFAV